MSDVNNIESNIRSNLYKSCPDIIRKAKKFDKNVK